MLVTFPGIVTPVRLVHPLKAEYPIAVSNSFLLFASITALFSDVQFANASPPMLVTLFGTVMLAKLLHSSNALSSNLVRPAGSVNPFRLLHSLKALLPILVTVLGITTLSTLLAF